MVYCSNPPCKQLGQDSTVTYGDAISEIGDSLPYVKLTGLCVCVCVWTKCTLSTCARPNKKKTFRVETNVDDSLMKWVKVHSKVAGCVCAYVINEELRWKPCVIPLWFSSMLVGSCNQHWLAFTKLCLTLVIIVLDFFTHTRWFDHMVDYHYYAYVYINKNSMEVWLLPSVVVMHGMITSVSFSPGHFTTCVRISWDLYTFGIRV